MTLIASQRCMRPFELERVDELSFLNERIVSVLVDRAEERVAHVAFVPRRAGARIVIANCRAAHRSLFFSAQANPTRAGG